MPHAPCPIAFTSLPELKRKLRSKQNDRGIVGNSGMQILKMRSFSQAASQNTTRECRKNPSLTYEVDAKRLDRIHESVTTKNRNCPISNTA